MLIAVRSNTFKGLCAVRICLGALRASLPKFGSARSVLRALHLHLPTDGTTLFARRRGRGAARARAGEGASVTGMFDDLIGVVEYE